MTFLFDINHPSHVHVFRNVIFKLRDEGHLCLVTARKKEHTHLLLHEFSIPFISTGTTPVSLFAKIMKGLVTIVQLSWIIISRKVDLVLSMESPYAVASAWLCRKLSFALADTETAWIIHKIIGPLSSTILVPDCFRKLISDNQISFNGYKELAYLHRYRFCPDRNVLDQYGIPVDKPYVIVRFVAFRAVHDKGHKGFSKENKLILINLLNEHVNVYITSETPLPSELEKFRLKINPVDIHHILAYASLFVGESTTMSAEAAVLGVPSICINDTELGYIREQADKYQLVYKYSSLHASQVAAIDKAVEIAKNPSLKDEWQKRRDMMLKDKMDVTDFMLRFIENYTT